MELIFLIVSFLSSIVGAICGIGGGVVIKPVLDMLQLGAVSTINFLSGCTVLSMSLYSVGKSMIAWDSKVALSTGTPLAIGAAIGGVAGKELFGIIKGLFANGEMVGGVQAVALGLITVGTLLYTVNKAKISTRQITSKLFCVVVGLMLGIMSSFLGIGGGPINLVVLGYLFSMDSKTAAANSLYIILFSQLASLIATLISGVPEFRPLVLILMVAGGIGGGIVGRALNKKMDNRAVDKLFIALMVVIIGICIYNAFRAFA
ncbi:MAG: sulfite exporter TauE/SafE family protein [Ruminococcaceae bacterium]|nr:sulfite exporter TauE/SafE family protein [Oscillospiraceae bacterium]